VAVAADRNTVSHKTVDAGRIDDSVNLVTTLSSSSACSTAFISCATGLSRHDHFTTHGLCGNTINSDDYENILRYSLESSCGATYYRYSSIGGGSSCGGGASGCGGDGGGCGD
jgi:hypothetical protein